MRRELRIGFMSLGCSSFVSSLIILLMSPEDMAMIWFTLLTGIYFVLTIIFFWKEM